MLDVVLVWRILDIGYKMLDVVQVWRILDIGCWSLDAEIYSLELSTLPVKKKSA